MKKLIIIIAIIIGVLSYMKDDSIIIPRDAIRFRVVSNSNSIDDQIVKNKLALNIETYISNVLKNSEGNKNDSLLINYNNIKSEIDEFLKQNNESSKYELLIGKNYFPKKEYKGVKYESGYYDSVVIKLGNAKGGNWWCVIYPNLCLINDDITNKEYTSVVNELIKKM